MKFDAEITIIGAGVVGLSIAYELSKKYEGIFVIEKNENFGEETSSRSSEVVHSGIYYPTNSLKTKLCIEGRKLLYNFCDEFEVIYNKCGKLIVATITEEVSRLDEIYEQGKRNGVENVKRLTAEETKKLEPNINAQGALLVSETGVVDSYGFMKQLEICSVNNGVEMVYNSTVSKIEKITTEGYALSLNEKDGGVFDFSTRILINAAGLYSDRISDLLGIQEPNYKLHFCKGEYFAVGNSKNKLVNRLIYPVPNKNLAGLGVHATKDINDGLKLGPNVIYLENNKTDYTVDIEHKDNFYQSAKRFFPFLEKEDLYPAYSGIRPKLQRKGDPFRDFVIKEEIDKGFKNYYNLIGIESPGLTSSLAIGKYINELIKN